MSSGTPLTGWGLWRGFLWDWRGSGVLAGGVNEGLTAMKTHQSRESHKGKTTNEERVAEIGETKVGQNGSVRDIVDMKRKKRKHLIH
jgi:hypothetical protein